MLNKEFLQKLDPSSLPYIEFLDVIVYLFSFFFLVLREFVQIKEDNSFILVFNRKKKMFFWFS